MDIKNEIIEIKRRLDELEARINKSGNLENKDEFDHSENKNLTIMDHINRLKCDGFFNEPKTLKEINEKLSQEGFHYLPQSLTSPLQRAMRKKVLGRVKKGDVWAYCRR